jgi:hypothetical protein
MKKIVLGILATTMLLSSVGCGGGGNAGGGEATFFEMDAFTNNSTSAPYDSEYFYRNEFKQFGSDTSSIYVPEGRHTDENGVDLYGG